MIWEGPLLVQVLAISHKLARGEGVRWIYLLCIFHDCLGMSFALCCSLLEDATTNMCCAIMSARPNRPALLLEHHHLPSN
jgi:hypothetical protein